MVAAVDWVMERVEPENERGAETVVVCATPVALVERRVVGRSETVRLEVLAVPEYSVPETLNAVELAYAICDVEEAWSPCVNQIGVEVELATAP